jgi:hypothetical protein
MNIPLIITCCFLFAIFLIARSTLWKEFKSGMVLLRNYSDSFRLTPYWTWYENKNNLTLLRKIIFGKYNYRLFRHRKVKNSSDISGIILYKVISKGDKTIEFTDIVFDNYNQTSIKIKLSRLIEELLSSYPGYSITMYTTGEEKTNLILDILNFVKAARCNLINQNSAGKKVEKVILYKDL